MINLKNDEEIKWMWEGGSILKEIADELVSIIEPGMTTNQIEAEALKKLKEKHAEPSFTKVKGYKWATCLPVNEQAVHTPPSDRKLTSGDLLTLDIGAYYHKLHTDYATTVVIGGENQTPNSVRRFLNTGKKALDNAIKIIHSGQRLGMVSKLIEQEITEAGYFILKELTGHGIGKDLHEDPYVQNYLDRPISQTYAFQPGLTVAIEIIYSMGTCEIEYEPGISWSIVTKDRSLSACFEKSIAVTEKETFILT